MAPAFTVVGMAGARRNGRPSTDRGFQTDQAQHQGRGACTTDHAADSKAVAPICGHALPRNKRLICDSIASFQSEHERSLIRTLLAGGLWNAVRAHQRGMITSQCCPYYQQADEIKLHILWECREWCAALDLHLANIHALAAKVPELPPFGLRA